MKKLLLTLVILALCSGGAYLMYRYAHTYMSETVPVETDIKIVQSSTQPLKLPTSNLSLRTSKSIPNPESRIQNAPALPSELNLKVTFYSQAPFGDWSMPWQEGCEEASSLLVANMYLNKNWNVDQFNQEILKLVDWENKHFNTYLDTTVAQVSDMLSANFGLKSIIHDDPSLVDIQNIVAQGHLIIMPLAGKELKNPFYSNGGPTYHMLVIKGYKAGEKVITSDVGTKRGDNYVYDWAVLDTALHDFASPIEYGKKRILEVLPAL